MMVTMEEGTELPYRFSVEFSDVDDYDRAIAFLRDEIGKPMMVVQKKAKSANR
jgi:hypothetical protein